MHALCLSQASRFLGQAPATDTGTPPYPAPLSPTAPCTEPGLGTGYIILISVAAFTVVAVASTLLILRYQRARGKYNLRIQSDDFSYQVFSQ